MGAEGMKDEELSAQEHWQLAQLHLNMVLLIPKMSLEDLRNARDMFQEEIVAREIGEAR